MKIRNGFVSNSSTASFIVTFSATIPQKDVEQIIRLSESSRFSYELVFRFAEDGAVEAINRGEEEERKEWIIPMEKNMFGFYDMELSTFMFNDWMDVDCWKFVRMLAENRNSKLSLVQIIKTEEEYTDCYEYVSFDPQTWGRDRRRQKEADEKYNRYLEELKELKLL